MSIAVSRPRQAQARELPARRAGKSCDRSRASMPPASRRSRRAAPPAGHELAVVLRRPRRATGGIPVRHVGERVHSQASPNSCWIRGRMTPAPDPAATGCQRRCSRKLFPRPAASRPRPPLPARSAGAHQPSARRPRPRNSSGARPARPARARDPRSGWNSIRARRPSRSAGASPALHEIPAFGEPQARLAVAAVVDELAPLGVADQAVGELERRQELLRCRGVSLSNANARPEWPIGVRPPAKRWKPAGAACSGRRVHGADRPDAAGSARMHASGR